MIDGQKLQMMKVTNDENLFLVKVEESGSIVGGRPLL
jgi:hypothetical protein